MFTPLLLVFNSYSKFLNQWISLTNAWLWPPQTFQNPQIKIFDQIDIKEKGTIFHIFSRGNLLYNLKNSGENLSLFQCNYVISKVNAKQNKMTSYFFLKLSSRLSHRKKNRFIYFLGHNCSLIPKQLRQKLLIDWMDLFFVLLLFDFFFVKVLL